MKVDKDFPSKTKEYYWKRQKGKKRAYNHKKHRESIKEQTRMEQSLSDPPVFKLETSASAEMPANDGEPLTVTSIWKVPDLTFQGYRYPALSRQYVITLNKAVNKEEFEGKVKRAFDMERQA